tara:strand:- start:4 stop:444 length:441 start_codon:yes stop_codon:yes gene_type:complete
MVCLGNICRSPLAHGILENKSKDKNIKVDSAGTASYHIGSPPDPRSIEVAKINGIDISSQIARKFSYSDFDNFDIIYVMDKSNYLNIIKLTDNESHKSKVKLILEELNLHIKEVPDPYYGVENRFSYVYELLDEACKVIVDKYAKK